MKIYSQGDQAIVISIEKKVSKDLTEDLLALRSYLNKKIIRSLQKLYLLNRI